MTLDKLALNFTDNKVKQIWKNMGTAIHALASISGADTATLELLLREAECKKREKKSNAYRTRILRSIEARGIKLVEKLEDTYLDINDIKGLIGEMLLENMIHSKGSIPIYVKWRKSGSSHTVGIDILASQDDNPKKLLVGESKHTHNEIKLASAKHIIIRDKCLEALEQSDVNHILTSLSRVVTDFAENINFHEGSGGEVKLLEDKYNFLKECLEKRDYQLAISIFSESLYCTTDVFDLCLDALPPHVPEYGENIKINIVGIGNLEKTTELMCDKFVEPRS